MTAIENALQSLISELTTGKNYKKQQKDFEKWVELKDRTNNELKYFLLFDIDHRDYKYRSEYNVTHNQIILMTATLPPKRDKNKPITYKSLDYREKEPE